jgi:NAD(P)H dehydrogenase (quinone)
VTGATGAVGRKVARLLSARGRPLRLVVRDPARAPTLPSTEITRAAYADGAAMQRALKGVDTLFLVSAKESPSRVEEHRVAVDAAAAAGVERIVYLSFLNASEDATFTFARDHFRTEQHIRSRGFAFTFVRPCLYLDLVPAFVRPDDTISGPAGEGRAAWVARDDVAEVIGSILGAEDPHHHDGVTYDVTGRETLGLDDVADRLSRAVGRTITYRRETLGEARASRAVYGAPAWEIEGWVTSYAAIAADELSTVSDTVPRLTGHPARTLKDFIAEHPEAVARLLRR